MSLVHFYSLLYVADGAESHVNVPGSVRDPLSVYVNCGLLVAKSCAALGIPYSIITNKPEEITRRLGAAAREVRLVVGRFDRQVPGDARFFSAHYKLDVLKSFGSGEHGEFVGLVDLDVMFVRRPEFSLEALKKDTLYVYDLTAVEQAAYPGSLQDTFDKLGVPGRPRWFGGEFIAGSRASFAMLSNRIEEFWPRYELAYRALHHMGDETIVTAALASLQDEGMLLIDAGDRSGVAVPAVVRWWSARTLHRQPAFDAVNRAAILHLPADKEFLAQASAESFQADRIVREYVRHVRRKWRVKRLAFPFVNLFARKKQHLPALSS